MIIHWSDWSDRPDIHVACTQAHYPHWDRDKDLPKHVYKISDAEIFCTFNTELVTCEHCKKLELFIEVTKFKLANLL